jgi:hypothetical protein
VNLVAVNGVVDVVVNVVVNGAGTIPVKEKPEHPASFNPDMLSC